MAVYARSILDRFREEVEREKDKTVLQLQTQIFRGFLSGDRPVSNLGGPRIGELVPLGFDYERERMDRPSTRPDNFLDAIRRIPDEDLGIAPRPSRELPRPDTAPQPSADEGGGLFGGLGGLAGDIGGFLGGLPIPGGPITITGGGMGGSPRAVKVRDFPQAATTPMLPESALEQIGRVPIFGTALEREAEVLSTPLGISLGTAFPAVTAAAAAGGVAAGTAGEGLEALGAAGPL